MSLKLICGNHSWVLAIRIIHDKMSIALQSGFPFHPIVLKLLYLAFNSVGLLCIRDGNVKPRFKIKLYESIEAKWFMAKDTPGILHGLAG